ncbi:putative MFS multidrug transporter [Rhizoctonia solani 123E]|uniref:Putative MFS multidrug transporter n=1 Tax=Rhizoctonia solani 123E TaxID=1423351 RepID=A0A074RUQ1_9AGAM|nr:putative MFS multidrug transporter [Rhizoctonia solani 123E]
MATSPDKLDSRHGQDTMTSPSATITPSIRYSSDLPKEDKDQEGRVTVVDWLPDDPENPMNWKISYRRFISLMIGLSCFCVAFSSSCYAAAVPGVIRAFGPKLDVALLGLSLFVLGFGLGPLVWGPLSELYGRRFTFFVSFIPYTLFHLGAGLSKNIETLLIMRLLGGCFGSSVFSVPGGSLADMFTREERGPLALIVLAVSPLLGPVCGPIVGGFIAQSDVSWRWNFWVMLIFSGVVLVLYTLFVPETCHSVLLKRRVAKLRASNPNTQYMTKYEGMQSQSPIETLRLALSRPILLLTHEPIVLVLSFYTALIYGTLYGMFAAYPIVFVQHRHFTYGQNGLAFLGIGIGIFISVVLAGVENRRYLRAVQKHGGHAPPEERLVSSFYSAILFPISLIWFAWTTYPSVHWIVPILSGIPFGLASVIGFTAVVSYMVDSYPLYAASCLAANGIMRSIVAFAFPLFIPHLFERAGDQWGSMFCAFLALVCVPIPFILYKYGPAIRAKSKLTESLITD